MAIENTGGTKFKNVGAGPVAPAVSRGEAAIGLQQMSELLGQPGIDVVGPLPPEVQHFTIVDAVLNPKSKNPQLGLSFLDFLRSPEALAIIKNAGVDGP